MICLKRLMISLALLLSAFANPTLAEENPSEINQVKVSLAEENPREFNQVKALLFSSSTFKEAEKDLNDNGFKMDRSECSIKNVGNGIFQVYLTYMQSASVSKIGFQIYLPAREVSPYYGITSELPDPGWNFPWFPFFW